MGRGAGLFVFGLLARRMFLLLKVIGKLSSLFAGGEDGHIRQSWMIGCELWARISA